MQPSNTVIIIGTLAASRRGQRDNLPALDRRNAVGATVRYFRVQSVSAFGDEFPLDLEVSPQVEGSELLVSEHIGKPIVIEGVVRREVERDRRYATTEQSIGERIVSTGVQVQRIRAPEADEEPGSAVWLEGEVSAEPRFSPHRLLPGMLLARVVLRVLVARSSSVPGSRAIIPQPIDVGVVVPTLAEGAGALYRPGNCVRVEGQLDITLIPQTANPQAQARLRQLDDAWASQRESLSEQELSQALRRYRGQRALFIESPLLTVVAGYIELLSGEALGEAEAQVLLERSNAERRRRRIAAQSAVVHGPPAGEVVAEQQTSADVEAESSHAIALEVHSPDVAAQIEPGTAAEATRISRRRRIAGVSDVGEATPA